MPADHETIRIWGLHNRKADGTPSLFREVLGGGGPGRPWADGSDVVHIVPNSRNLPAEFSEQRYPVLVESLALRTDSAGAGKRRGGFGYDKRVRSLGDCLLLSNADRSELAPYGVNGGKAGDPTASRSRARTARRAPCRAWSTTCRSRPASWSSSGPPAAAAGATRSSARSTWSATTSLRSRVARAPPRREYGVVFASLGARPTRSTRRAREEKRLKLREARARPPDVRPR